MERTLERRAKFSKRVTWSLQLTDVKVMTPQPTIFEEVADIIFMEKDEDMVEDDQTSETFGKVPNEA